MGLCSHTVLPLQVTWTCGERQISPRTATIAWTRVHAISDFNTCLKYGVSGRDLRAHLTPRGNMKIAGLSSKRMPHDQDRTVHSLEANRTAQRIHGRTPRLRSDRTAIAARSSRDRGSSIVESKPRSSTQDSTEILPIFGAKLKRSQPIFEAKLKMIVARS